MRSEEQINYMNKKRVKLLKCLVNDLVIRSIQLKTRNLLPKFVD
jgi:hypothetical protein